MNFLEYIIVKRDNKAEAAVRLSYQSIIVMMLAIIVDIIAWEKPLMFSLSFSSMVVALIAVLLALDANRLVANFTVKPLEAVIAFWGSVGLFIFIAWNCSYLILHTLTTAASF